MEDRAFSFANRELVRVVRDFCVPVTRNKFRPSRYENDEKFWQTLCSQGMGGHVVSYCFCTAGGKVLGLYSRDEAGIRAAFTRWRGLPESERKPVIGGERGAVLPQVAGRFEKPKDSLALRVYFRVLARDRDGRLRAPERISLGISKTVVRAEANGDYCWLKPDEWRSLVPADPKPGDQQPLPRPICRRIARFHLVDGACCLARFHDDEQGQACRLTLTVERASPTGIDLRLGGTARVGKAPGAEFRLDGFLHYSPPEKRFTRFDVVALAEGLHRDIATDKPMPLGIAFELISPDSPEFQLPPYRLWYDNDGVKDYFGR